MNTSTSLLFSAGMKVLKKGWKRGRQTEISQNLGIEKGHLSGIIMGDRGASPDLQARIASQAGHTYEEVLLLGRRVIEGGEEQKEAVHPTTIAGGIVTRDDELVLYQTMVRRRTVRFLDGTKEVVESDTEYFPRALENNIDAFQVGVRQAKENMMLSEDMRKMREEQARQGKQIDALLKLLGQSEEQKKSANGTP